MGLRSCQSLGSPFAVWPLVDTSGSSSCKPLIDGRPTDADDFLRSVGALILAMAGSFSFWFTRKSRAHR